MAPKFAGDPVADIVRAALARCDHRPAAASACATMVAAVLATVAHMPRRDLHAALDSALDECEARRLE